MTRAAKDLRVCSHPVNDAVVLVHSVAIRDLMVGRLTTVLGYYCPLHGRFGHWKVVAKVEVPAEIRVLFDDGVDHLGAGNG
jgi:hypothetical protein